MFYAFQDDRAAFDRKASLGIQPVMGPENPDVSSGNCQVLICVDRIISAGENELPAEDGNGAVAVDRIIQGTDGDGSPAG